MANILTEWLRRKPEIIRVPEERSPGYRKWIENGAKRLRKELPFKGPADVSITLGSGISADSLLSFMDLRDVRHISYEDIGLPIGFNQNHKKEIIAGITPEGKKVILVNGRTHAYELPEGGLKTRTWGNLERMELATGYIAMLNEIGVENMILTCAAGGINHPMKDGDPKPFDPDKLPVISLIGADLNDAYPSPNLGHYKSRKKDFFGLKDADQDLMAMFGQSMIDTGEKGEIPVVYYITSKSTPNFEDKGVVYDAAFKGGDVVGMSFSYEKEFISGMDKIGRFMGIAVVTNPVELVYTNPSPFRTMPSISINEIRQHKPQEFKLAFHASDEEVRKMGKLANERLGKGLTQMVKIL
ncbi:hypothetical protein HZA76_02445 [Candidatus Roizmanbacteria bacterium]|nr:hypothetical protein [Candidatus Roizmanbacteria bacterium]